MKQTATELQERLDAAKIDSKIISTQAVSQVPLFLPFPTERHPENEFRTKRRKVIGNKKRN
jgi:vacuolar-type H+-ATPase subunit F/Vma7